MNQYLAELRIFPFNFAPTGWAMCNGQLIPIAQNPALFSLIGTFYGGNGTSNFALPNLQGSVPMSFGDGPGLSSRFLGEAGGSPTVTLITSEMPLHSHSFSADPQAKKEQSTVNNNAPAAASGANFYSTAAPNVSMSPQTLPATGGSLPHDNMQPFLTLNICIALTGIFPPRG